jgi:hypothetical protein
MSEILLAAFGKLQGRSLIDADIIELLSCRHKSILSGDLHVKNQVWSIAVSET